MNYNTSGEVGVPPLQFINDSPCVTGRNVEVNLFIGLDIEAVECQVIRQPSGNVIRTLDCEFFSSTENGLGLTFTN